MPHLKCTPAWILGDLCHVPPPQRGCQSGTVGKRGLFQTCLRAGGQPLLDHTPGRAGWGRLGPMIRIDQLILATVACVTALRLAGLG